MSKLYLASSELMPGLPSGFVGPGVFEFQSCDWGSSDGALGHASVGGVKNEYPFVWAMANSWAMAFKRGPNSDNPAVSLGP